LLYYSNEVEKLVPGGDLFKFGSILAGFLDSETPKISLMAMNSIVGICAI